MPTQARMYRRFRITRFSENSYWAVLQPKGEKKLHAESMDALLAKIDTYWGATV